MFPGLLFVYLLLRHRRAFMTAVLTFLLLAGAPAEAGFFDFYGGPEYRPIEHYYYRSYRRR